MWLERAPKRTKGLGTGFEGQESVCFSEDAVQSWGRQCLCRPEASTPAWGDLIHDHMERDPACAADLAKGQAVAVPTPCQTLDGHSFSLLVVG